MLDLSMLADAVRQEGSVSRRLFLAYAASLSAVPWLGRTATAARRQRSLAKDPFQLGVASGDPAPTGVVLWTRLAPQPLEPMSGMEPENVKVAWEVAADEAMRKIVHRGTAIASPHLAHSVHAEVDNLEPDHWYWYRFRAGDAESPIGRTRTMPAEDSTPAELRMAFASCQNFQTGYFTAYEHMAKDEPDLVIHLGDYIYDNGPRKGEVREHVRHRLDTLDDYRARHSQYKTDAQLQLMHSRSPWLVTWDDHEVANDYTGNVAQKEHELDPVKFLEKRAAAYQAYYENMPLRHTSLPHGPNMQMYRKFSFGRLAEFMVLDGRQYRTPQPNGDHTSDINEAARSPHNTMLGKHQLAWLKDSLAASGATWNVLANQVVMAQIDRKKGPDREYPMDDWCGYVHERNKLVEFMKERHVSNPVVITGDNHANWVNELRTDDLRSETPVVATEFAGTSISSGGNGSERRERAKELMAENAGVKFFNDERGYVLCTIAPNRWQSDFRVVPEVLKPNGPVVSRASFVVEAGRPGAKRRS